MESNGPQSVEYSEVRTGKYAGEPIGEYSLQKGSAALTVGPSLDKENFSSGKVAAFMLGVTMQSTNDRGRTVIHLVENGLIALEHSKGVAGMLLPLTGSPAPS